jgi:hypothetical protein
MEEALPMPAVASVTFVTAFVASGLAVGVQYAAERDVPQPTQVIHRHSPGPAQVESARGVALRAKVVCDRAVTDRPFVTASKATRHLHAWATMRDTFGLSRSEPAIETEGGSGLAGLPLALSDGCPS